MLQQFLFFAITTFVIPLSLAQGLASDLAAPANPAAERGSRFLTDTAMIPADFHESTFDEVWKAWPQPLKSKAAIVSPAERRAMAFDRYGLWSSAPYLHNGSVPTLWHLMRENINFIKH